MSQPELDPQLTNLILQQLLAQPNGLPEHQLLKSLADQGYPQFTPSQEPLELFQAHFLLFHILYRQQDSWRHQGHGCLDIHCLAIKFIPCPETSNHPSQLDPLRDYYLDYQAYRDTQSDDVIALLDSFWQSFGDLVQPEAQDQAREILEIPHGMELSLKLVNAHYRRLTQLHHPDKGGDKVKFQHISQAAETLRKAVKRN